MCLCFECLLTSLANFLTEFYFWGGVLIFFFWFFILDVNFLQGVAGSTLCNYLGTLFTFGYFFALQKLFIWHDLICWVSVFLVLLGFYSKNLCLYLCLHEFYLCYLSANCFKIEIFNSCWFQFNTWWEGSRFSLLHVYGQFSWHSLLKRPFYIGCFCPFCLKIRWLMCLEWFLCCLVFHWSTCHCASIMLFYHCSFII